MTFLLSEDGALRDLLKGIVVSDDKNPTRPVGVWFGTPDMEIRSQEYPYITINLIDISEAKERTMVGHTNANYLRPTQIPEDTEDSAWLTGLPIPVNLDYQITTWARHPRHDRSILAQLLGHRLPLRFGSINCDDNTVRRLDMLDISKRDTIEANKRLFSNVFTIRISSEIPSRFYELYSQVGSVGIDMAVFTPSPAEWQPYGPIPMPWVTAPNGRPPLQKFITLIMESYNSGSPDINEHITITPNPS